MSWKSRGGLLSAPDRSSLREAVAPQDRRGSRPQFYEVCPVVPEQFNPSAELGLPGPTGLGHWYAGKTVGQFPRDIGGREGLRSEAPGHFQEAGTITPSS